MKKVYIGIDAHKESNLVALAFDGRGDPQLYGKAPADLPGFVKDLRKIMEKHRLLKEEVALCYEAGPTGFVLARRLRALGFECEVVAPSLVITSELGDLDRFRHPRRLMAYLGLAPSEQSSGGYG